jgi:hypothetical protein
MATLYTTNQLLFVIRELLKRHDLTEWEAGFVRSVDFAMRSGRQLSSPQAVCLSNIWDRVDGSVPPNTPPPV